MEVKADKMISRLYVFQLILLLQFLLILTLFISIGTTVIFVDFFITIAGSLIIVVYFVLKKKSFLHAFLNLLFVVGSFYSMYLNEDQVIVSHYQLVLIQNETKLRTIMNGQSNPLLIKQVNGLKCVNACDSVTFFYFDDENPTFYGLAYSKETANPEITGVGLQQINCWLHIHGNWYFWFAIDPY